MTRTLPGVKAVEQAHYLWVYQVVSRRDLSVIGVYWGVRRMIAVVETEEFLADVKGVLSEDEHEALIWYVAQYPEAGDLTPETGGLRKLRWTAKGKGKRGGSRVIYYFHNIVVPLFLMAIFAKNVQIDLSAQQRVALARQLRALKSDWKKKGTK